MHNHKLPKQWNQISVEQFLELRRLSSEDGMFNYQIDVLSALTDSDISDFEDLDIDELGKLTEQIKWIQSEPSKRYKNKIDNYVLKPYSKSGNLSSNLDCRTFNSAFRNYARDNGLDTYANAGIFTPIFEGYGAIADASSGLLGGVGSFFNPKTIKTILTIVVVGAVGFGGLYAYRTLKK